MSHFFLYILGIICHPPAIFSVHIKRLCFIVSQGQKFKICCCTLSNLINATATTIFTTSITTACTCCITTFCKSSNRSPRILFEHVTSPPTCIRDLASIRRFTVCKKRHSLDYSSLFDLTCRDRSHPVVEFSI